MSDEKNSNDQGEPESGSEATEEDNGFFKRKPPIPLTGEQIAEETEVSDRQRDERRRLLPKALLVGLVSGGLAVLFRRLLEILEDGRSELLHGLSPLYRGLASMALITCGATLAIWLVRRFSPAASGSGIPQLKGVMAGKRAINALSLLWVKFLGGLLSIGSGLALGREGPTVQMGGAIAQALGKVTRTAPEERKILLTAGAGAGLAAAFNAPLAGLIFVLEEFQRGFAPRMFFASFLACVVADTVTRGVHGQTTVFHTGGFEIPALMLLPLFLLLGVMAGALGVAFNRSLVGVLDFVEPVKRMPAIVPGLAAGIFVGGFAFLDPEVLGSGHDLVHSLFTDQPPAIRIIVGFFTIRFFLTLISYATGAPGGIFAPLLVLGALSGLLVGVLGSHLFPELVPRPAVFAVVGMAALFASVVRAPLTGIVLIMEMTGGYALMLPLMVACLTAWGVAEWFKDRPIYEVLLERDLRAQQIRLKEE